MAKRSKLHFGCAISAAVLATIPGPASAAKWMIIGAEPEPAPHRSIYVMSADDAWIFRRFADGFDKVDTDKSPDLSATLKSNTINTVIVYQVFENANGTNFISYNLDFRCQEGLVSIPQAVGYDRAGKQEKSGAPDWLKVPDNWIGKAEMIGCGWKNWQSAKLIWGDDGAPPPKTKKSKESNVSFASLGMEYLGEANYFRVTEVIDEVWKKRWPDAVQPAYYEGTPEEKAAAQAKFLAFQAETKTLLQDESKKIKDDMAMQAKIDKKLGRVGDKFFREMQGVGGKSEEDVIALWGTPQGLVETTPGVRQLNYYWSDTENVVVPYTVDIMGSIGNGGMGKVGETTQNRMETRNIQCYRKLFLKEGGRLPGYRVFDFDIGCS